MQHINLRRAVHALPAALHAAERMGTGPRLSGFRVERVASSGVSARKCVFPGLFRRPAAVMLSILLQYHIFVLRVGEDTGRAGPNFVGGLVAAWAWEGTLGAAWSADVSFCKLGGVRVL